MRRRHQMRWLWRVAVALALMAGATLGARGEFDPCPGGEPCDDPAVLGNEILTANPSPTATSYRTRSGEVEICVESEPICDVSAAITAEHSEFLMLACNEHGCSPGEIESIEFRPWACFRGADAANPTGCIHECEGGAPIPYSEIARCE